MMADDLAPNLDAPGVADAARTAAATRLARGALHRTPEALKPPALVHSDEDYDALAPGTVFIAPDGGKRKKPWVVREGTEDSDFDAVPEGESFIDPTGAKRQKPKYEPVGLTANILYDMAANDKERFNALARSYGKENVKQDSKGEFYVESDGKRLKPGRGAAATGGLLTSMAAPVAASTLGGLGGGALGSAGGPLGTVGGAVGGAAAGGAAGQAFNDTILSIAGVYDRTPGEEALGLAGSAAAGGIGEGAGRAIGAAYPIVKSKVQDIVAGTAVPKLAAKKLGATLEDTERAHDLMQSGYRVAPSSWLKEFPYAHKVVESFDPHFRTQNVLKESAERRMNEGSADILKKMGVDTTGLSVTKPTAAVSSERAGQRLMAKAAEEVRVQDQALADVMKLEKESAERGVNRSAGASTAAKDNLYAAEKASRDAAQRAISLTFDDIKGDVASAVKAAETGENAGDLWQSVAEKFRAANAAIKRRAAKMYEDAHELGGSQPLNTGVLQSAAKELIDTLPENFASKHPDIVRRIAKLAGEEPTEKEAAKGVVQEEVPVTFAQLHNLRSQIRSDIEYTDLTPSIKEGALKRFNGLVNQVLHDVEQNPHLENASRMLDAADKFYADNIKLFHDRSVQAIVSGLKAGVPADPKVLVKTLLKDGRTELIRQVEKTAGPTLWNAVRAADVQEMLDASQTLIPGQIDGVKFAKMVENRIQDNLLEAIHGPNAARLRTQAQRLAALEGKLDVNALPGDTVVSLIKRADEIAKTIKEQAGVDPVKMLGVEMKRIEQDHAAALRDLQQQRSRSPLKFLYDPTYGASEAADHILKSQDLVFATAAKFGKDSPEFTLLRQTWAQRLLTDTLNPTERLAKITPEMQAMMMPGVLLDDAHKLARDMDFLLGSKKAGDAGASIAAASRVLHPPIPDFGAITMVARKVPAVGRLVLGAYYAALSDFLSQNPVFAGWLLKGLRGTPAQRETVKTVVQELINGGGAFGARWLQGAYQAAKTEQGEQKQ